LAGPWRLPDAARHVGIPRPEYPTRDAQRDSSQSVRARVLIVGGFCVATALIAAVCVFGAARHVTATSAAPVSVVSAAVEMLPGPAESVDGLDSADGSGIEVSVDVLASPAIVDRGAVPFQPPSTTGDDFTSTVTLTGRQSEIDLCSGLVDTTAWYGTPMLVEHWGCGGELFPRWTGAQVRLAGIDAGVYRVTGVIGTLSAGTAMVSDVPHGHDLVFQTCLNGNSADMVLIGLSRIG
jgi:hypothetical protein